jgi:predicted amidohydrolase
VNITVASIQAAVTLGGVNENIEKLLSLLNEAKQRYSPDIILLPETWNVGFFPENVSELADDPEGFTQAKHIGAWAKENAVNVVAGSVAVVEDGHVKNRAFVFDRSGKAIATYDKIHLFSPGKEDQFFTPGSQRLLYKLDGITCGLIICYDLRFPELSRRLALEGAQILFVPAQWPFPRVNHWQVLSCARAIENQMYVVTCNGAGTAGDIRFCGHSAIIDPFGEVLAQADEKETIIAATLDLNKIEEVRSRIPVFKDRNPKAYE